MMQKLFEDKQLFFSSFREQHLFRIMFYIYE